MALDYTSLEEAKRLFNWSERWGAFDGGPDALNITQECVDRHYRENIAVFLQNSDGSRETYTFGELSDWTSQYANMLAARGVKPGDRVAVVLNPSIEYYIAFFGTLKMGAVVVPCYPLLGPDGISYRITSAEAKLAVISNEREHIIPPELKIERLLADDLRTMIAAESGQFEAQTSSDDLAVIQFSSGTTGQPKQVLYTHHAVTITAVFVKFWIGLKPGDRFMCTSSPAWGHGIWYGTVGPMIFGNGIGAYSGKFETEVLLAGMEAFGTTVASFIPRVYKMIMDSGQFDKYDLKLRRLTYAGDAMEDDVVDFFQEQRGLSIASSYGNTESGPIVIDCDFKGWTHRKGSAGKPFFITRIGILDDDGNEVTPGTVGEVAVWRNDRWNPIGDYGFLDEDDYFFPRGRSDDVIKSSGYRIGPFEIEVTLEKHPSVEKAAVVGSPDEERGQIVKAFIIPKKGADTSQRLVDELKAFVKGRLSMHEYPKEIEFVDELPETPDGKLKRKVLKSLEYERKRKVA
ncbi:AMP-binding protein [Desulfosarcina ovata subsp. sediminis]|uniref:AMP-binding protein n=1 Tax=Desulfosarcina ovata subsp. sediminis TaxID=885957 RepID=A0A5K7ZJB7_9BACT|nr:acyl-CoA synthetase [Desulfosarcina ovata]BBO80971.1 AMP-binding protein [Desulfosarcina ovata subsp. sediminis]